MSSLQEKRDQIFRYESGVTSNRVAKGMPDPFSNMSYAGTDISATIVVPNIDRNTKTVGESDILEMAEIQTISY
jgi:hypothetical protein